MIDDDDCVDDVDDDLDTQQQVASSKVQRRFNFSSPPDFLVGS